MTTSRLQALPAAGAAPDPVREGSDSGFSLIELMVAMAIFTIVMTIVFGTMGWVVNSEGQVAAVSQSSAQVNAAFMQLDTEVRYAADINQPGTYGGDYWVEMESDWTVSSLGAPRCTQLEYDTTTGTLQQRTWLLGASVPSLASAQWEVLATGLSTAPQANPFVLVLAAPTLPTPGTTGVTIPVGGGATPWRLTVTLASSAGAGNTAATSQSSFTMSALNVTGSSTNLNVCGGTPS